MKKISGIQRLKLFYQQTISLKNLLSFSLLIYIWFILKEMKTDNLNGLGDFFKEIWDNLLISNMSGFLSALPIVLIVIVIIVVLIKVDNLSYLFKNNIYVLPGKITKTYNDRVGWGENRETRNYYDSKRISLFSNRVESYRKRSGYTSYRAKAQSDDGKFTTLWVDIPKKVARNRDKYMANIVIYNNEAVTFIYEKNR